MSRIPVSDLPIGSLFAALGSYGGGPNLYRTTSETPKRFNVEEVEVQRYSSSSVSGSRGNRYIEKTVKIYPIRDDAQWQEFKAAWAVLDEELDAAKEAHKEALERAWSVFHEAVQP